MAVFSAICFIAVFFWLCWIFTSGPLAEFAARHTKTSVLILFTICFMTYYVLGLGPR